MKALIFAAVLGAFALPALAQQSPGTGTNSGGPGRVGIPGQIGGGVPGTQPNNLERSQGTEPAAARPRTAKKRVKKSRRRR